MKIVGGFLPLTVFAKRSIVDIDRVLNMPPQKNSSQKAPGAAVFL